MTAAHGHVWSDWHPTRRGNMLERRCGCGAVERGTFEAVNTDALDRLDAMLAAYRRAFGTEVPRG